MSKRKPNQPQPAAKPKSSRKKKESQPTTFTEIGGSPVPGLTLRHVLRGHTADINRIAWSPDGRRPVLRDLQAVPKDGKPVIEFRKNNGARDRVRAAIAAAIEKRAKERATT